LRGDYLCLLVLQLRLGIKDFSQEKNIVWGGNAKSFLRIQDENEGGRATCGIVSLGCAISNLLPGVVQRSRKSCDARGLQHPYHFDLPHLGNAQDIMLCKAIYQSLLRYKVNSSEIEGDLAKNWAVPKDRLVYNFKLREMCNGIRGSENLRSSVFSTLSTVS